MEWKDARWCFLKYCHGVYGTGFPNVRTAGNGMRIAFCVYGIDWETSRRVEFYRQDWDLLTGLGHELTLVTKPLQLMKEKFDLAVVWWWNYLWLFGPILRARNIPVLTVGVFDVDSFGDLAFYKQWLKRWGLRFSDLDALVSRYEADRVAQYGVPPKQIRVSPLGVDIDYFQPAAQERNVVQPMLLNICWQRRGNMERKMLPELLKAFASVSSDFPQARLVLAGKPEDGGPVLKELAVQLGIADRVEFPGMVSREEKLRLLQSCALYCQVSRYEGFGLATAEALACGAPVLVSSVAAVPEVVGDGGTYVDTIDEAGIARGLAHCLGRLPEKMNRAMRNVDRMRDQFSYERRRRDYERFLEEVRFRRDEHA